MFWSFSFLLITNTQVAEHMKTGRQLFLIDELEKHAQFEVERL